MLGHAYGVAAGRAHYQDAAPRGFLEVDIVYADSRAAHYAQTRGFLQQLGRYFGRAAHDQGIRVRDLGIQRVFRGKDNVPTRAAQQFHAALTDFVSNDYFHQSS